MAMTKKQLIDNLNADLMNEYRHMHFYLHASFMVQGLHRAEIGEFLKESAEGEFKHIQEFAKVIVGLGGKPFSMLSDAYTLALEKSQPWHNSTGLTSTMEILEFALNMEEEVVRNYVGRMKEAREMDDTDGAFVEIFLEDQILDSRQDADELREMVKNCS